MEIVVDTSALLAVIVGEVERDDIVRLTSGHDLLAPGSVRWEVGNAFVSMMRQKRIDLAEAQRGVRIFESIAIRFLEVDLVHALSVADRAGIFAYDAYFLDCAMRHRAPVLTLDRKLARAAHALGVETLEV